MSRHGPRPRSIVIGAHPEALIDRFGLDAHLEVVASAPTLEGVATALRDASLSVVVVDLAEPYEAALVMIREVVTSGSPAGVVALTSDPMDDDLAARASSAGARACLTPLTVAEIGGAASTYGGRVNPAPQNDPDDERRDDEAGRGDLTSSQRDERLRNLVIGLIPLAGLIAGLVSLLWRQYLGQIGVRPVDLAVDPASRIADVFFTISVLVGLIGPQAFVGSWLDLIIGGVSDSRAAWLRRHRVPSGLVLRLLTFAAMVLASQFGQLLFALFVGPFVGGLLLAKMFDLDDDLPAVLQITRLRPGSAIAGAAVVFALFLAVLSYDVINRGPEFDESGESGWIAPSVLGFNAQPVLVTAVESGTLSEMLYLGGNADLYVLVDPCDGDRVDYVSVGATKLTVIERVACD